MSFSQTNPFPVRLILNVEGNSPGCRQHGKPILRSSLLTDLGTGSMHVSGFPSKTLSVTRLTDDPYDVAFTEQGIGSEWPVNVLTSIYQFNIACVN